MTAAKYLRKVSCSDAPQDLEAVRITIRYEHSERATASVEDTQQVLDPFVRLLEHGFLGCRGVSVVVQQAGARAVQVELRGRRLVLDAVVVALRLLIAMNDADPDDFDRLVQALDGDEVLARESYGGVDFERDVADIRIVLSGAGQPRPVTLWHLGDRDGAVRHCARLVVPGAAAGMPSPDLEDAILRVSAMRGFVPVGVDTAHEQGDEEWFVSGPDLVIDRISIEALALEALLGMLAVGPLDRVEA